MKLKSLCFFGRFLSWADNLQAGFPDSFRRAVFVEADLNQAPQIDPYAPCVEESRAMRVRPPFRRFEARPLRMNQQRRFQQPARGMLAMMDDDG